MYPAHVHPPNARTFAWAYYTVVLCAFVAYSCVLVLKRWEGKTTAPTIISQYDISYKAPKLAFCPPLRPSGPLFEIQTNPSPLSYPIDCETAGSLLSVFVHSWQFAAHTSQCP